MVTITACSAGTAGSTGSDTAPTGPTTTTGPLDEFLSGPSRSPEEMQVKERQVQDLIVSCMAAEGFEYRPFVMPMMTGEQMPGPQWGTREFAAKYGYGITSGPWSSAAPTTDQPVDPNQAIVDAMSDSEREAYFEALHGPAIMAQSSAVEIVESSPGTDAETTAATPAGSAPASAVVAGTSAAESAGTTEAMPTVETAGTTEVTAARAMPMTEGCWNTSSNQVYGGGQVTGEFDDLMNRMSQVWDQSQKDPAVVEVQDRWTACLADAGHPGFTSIDQPQQQIIDKSNKFYESQPQPDPTQTSFDEAAASSAMAAITGSPDYAALQTEEIALAVADAECKEKVGYQQTLDEVSRRLQQQFVDDNRAELERYRDAMNGGG